MTTPLAAAPPATPTLNRMSKLDSEFFFAEHENVPMHIGCPTSVASVLASPPITIPCPMWMS
jgi:hypothetical protein